jgi:hypothetical protein
MILTSFKKVVFWSKLSLVVLLALALFVAVLGAGASLANYTLTKVHLMQPYLAGLAVVLALAIGATASVFWSELIRHTAGLINSLLRSYPT